jgi:transposase-like protein
MSRRNEKTGNHRRVWPEPIKAKAIEMLTAGYPDSEVSHKLGVPLKTISLWAYKFKVQRGTSRPLDKSGVVAPSAYHRGSRWGASWF